MGVNEQKRLIIPHKRAITPHANTVAIDKDSVEGLPEGR